MADYFRGHHKELLQEALVIAEEMTFDFFKLSASQWRRARYDILTLEALHREEISPHALALVAKYNGYPQDRLLPSAAFDFYRICIQDHNILKTLDNCGELRLLPLLSYILTHELVHLVRFSQFQAHFEASAAEKHLEEQRVHRLTQDILTPLNFLDLTPVIRYYKGCSSGGWQYAHL
ncbi:MAG: hypothetical protein A2Y80_09545 [Deltaproteobacteria bacterium RBG_13_58_19]|nr:MAG: hypothetical protein A2Y80_09545 [Deltaproteobacteria bacterium RBG_13_58_19]